MLSGMVRSFKKTRSLVQVDVDVGNGGGADADGLVGWAGKAVSDGVGIGEGAGECIPEHAVTQMPQKIRQSKKEQMDWVRLENRRFSICSLGLMKFHQFGWWLFTLTGLVIRLFTAGQRQGYFSTQGALADYCFDFIGNPRILAQEFL